MIAVRCGHLDVQLEIGTPTHIVLAGRIDDSAALGELLPQIPAGGVVIDAGAITFINSIGMREWMRFARALRGRGTPVVLERVADVLMTQMNMFPEFARSVQVASFHAQYVCAACGAESVPVVDASRYADELRALRAPQLPCPDCGGPMDLGDFPERYLTIFQG